MKQFTTTIVSIYFMLAHAVAVGADGPDDIDDPIPVQLPAEPDDMPDMGMPDIDFE